MNCVLPLDSNAREPMSGSRMTYSRCIWRLEKKGKAADRAHVRKIVRAYASLRIRLLCTAVSADEQVLQLFVHRPYVTFHRTIVRHVQLLMWKLHVSRTNNRIEILLCCRPQSTQSEFYHALILGSFARLLFLTETSIAFRKRCCGTFHSCRVTKC